MKPLHVYAFSGLGAGADMNGLWTICDRIEALRDSLADAGTLSVFRGPWMAPMFPVADPAPVVVIGYSLGGRHAVDFARACGSRPVLLYAIDPVWLETWWAPGVTFALPANVIGGATWTKEPNGLPCARRPVIPAGRNYRHVAMPHADHRKMACDPEVGNTIVGEVAAMLREQASAAPITYTGRVVP